MTWGPPSETSSTDFRKARARVGSDLAGSGFLALAAQIRGRSESSPKPTSLHLAETGELISNKVGGANYCDYELRAPDQPLEAGNIKAKDRSPRSAVASAALAAVCEKYRIPGESNETRIPRVFDTSCSKRATKGLGLLWWRRRWPALQHLTQITVHNVAKLKPAWQYGVGGGVDFSNADESPDLE